ncbi:hypothetical protein Tdes44962_MAKER06093 [Teratosphaeria destructans]|uniref:Uncharacterized protein n=1 Tax=Teratosphaeria destructans TaxID=418781 RepID=A0A9W7SI40_9PEZI|nr:hypothetical protein Tdes44962_MAKER06093 [Teratosphaeria destructans]
MPPIRYENLSPAQALETRNPIRWSDDTKIAILKFCARECLSQHALCPSLIGRLMAELGWDWQQQNSGERISNDLYSVSSEDYG